MAGRKQSAGLALAIGSTVLIALIFLMLMLLVWGNSSSFLSKHYWVVVLMNNVGGLREGAPVKIGGVQIGKISTISLQSGSNDLEIALSIEEARNIPSGSRAKISTAGLVGDAFLEIIPGKSEDSLRHAASIAEADRIRAEPAPDFSELMTQVDSLGSKLNELLVFVNDIMGEEQFRKNIKNIVANLDAVSYEANVMLQRGQRVVDNIDRATINVVGLTENLKGNIDLATGKVVEITDKVSGIADQVSDIGTRVAVVVDKAGDALDTAKGAVENLDGGITDIRTAVNNTIGDPEVAKNLSATAKNIADVTSTIEAKRPDIDALISNLGALSGDLKDVGGQARAIVGGIDPQKLATTFDALSGAITGVTGMVDKIMQDPVLALSVNKAADRIVKMKFDEMAKNNIKTSDQSMREIQRWTLESMNRGYYIDPSFPRDRRPYVIE